jgi:anti-sigma factor RsiW
MSATLPMDHEEAIGLLDALRDGELEGDEATRVEAHLASCTRCQAVEAALGGGLRKAVTTGVAADEPDLLPGVQRKLRQRSRGKLYAHEARAGTTAPWPLLLASVAVLLALAVGYAVLGHMTTAPSGGPPPSASLPR